MNKSGNMGLFKKTVVTRIVKKETNGFGAAVRDARLKLGLTQERFAKRVPMQRTTLTNIERGTQLLPLPKFILLCRALKTTPNDLLGF